jgi:hypothetical protein
LASATVVCRFEDKRNRWVFSTIGPIRLIPSRSAGSLGSDRYNRAMIATDFSSIAPRRPDSLWLERRPSCAAVTACYSTSNLMATPNG